MQPAPASGAGWRGVSGGFFLAGFLFRHQGLTKHLMPKKKTSEKKAA
jgi:hypothetical protein